ncbi:MAG: helix-turn-helix domain-containing protein [Zavarzinella sp.]
MWISPPEQNDAPLALRPREAARLLSISTRTLWELVRQGRVKRIKLGTAKNSPVMFRRCDLEAFLAAEMQQETSGDQGGQE